MHTLFADVNLPFITDMYQAVLEVVPAESSAGEYNFPMDRIDERLKDFLALFGVMISSAVVIFSPPHSTMDIRSGFTNEVRLHWVYSGAGSRLAWYDGDRVIESKVVNQPTIVNVGKPHAVISVGARPRWCLSLGLCSIATGKNLTMIELIEHIQPVVQGQHLKST
jgi:hypothetical protein